MSTACYYVIEHFIVFFNGANRIMGFVYFIKILAFRDIMMRLLSLKGRQKRVWA